MRTVGGGCEQTNKQTNRDPMNSSKKRNRTKFNALWTSVVHDNLNDVNGLLVIWGKFDTYFKINECTIHLLHANKLKIIDNQMI